MSRYTYTTVTTGSNDPRHYETTLLPELKPQVQDIYIYASYTDRLDNLAHKYYGNSKYWWVIAEANYIGKGTFAVKPGLQLRIPKPIDNLMTELEEAEKDK